MPAVAVELRAVGVLQADDVAGELDHRALQAQADAEERHLLLAGKADRLDLALAAAIAETAGDQDAVQPAEHALRPFAFDLLRLDPADDDAGLRGDAGVVERLVDRLVGVLVLDVLADDGDGDLVLRVLDPAAACRCQSDMSSGLACVEAAASRRSARRACSPPG